MPDDEINMSKYWSHYFYGQPDQDEVRPSGNAAPPTVEEWVAHEVCTHQWKQYVGIWEAFEYCHFCDLRKDKYEQMLREQGEGR